MTTLWMLFTWWFWILIIGWAALPLAWRLFGRFPDRGYALTKPLGLLLWAYALWLGSTVGALHNTLGGAVTAILFVLALSYLLARDAWRPDEQGERPLWRWLREHRGEVLFTEGLFLIAYLVWAYVRANSPDIATAGGEKFMEIAFINGVLTSRLFPPHDPWLAGYAISYYYFGYVMIGGLIQLSRVPASVGFNLAGASWFALTVVSAYGVVRGLIGFRRQENGHRVWGILGAVVLALMGNLEGFLEVLYARRLLPVGFWQWLDIRSINVPYDPSQPASWIPQRFIWWWQASRVLHDKDLLGNTMEVIDEFPAFSFILGDMHPHVLGLPFVLLAIAFALALFARPVAEPVPSTQRTIEEEGALSGLRRLYSRIEMYVAPHFPARADVLLYALALGGLAFLNTWDFPIYLLLVMGVVAVRAARRTGKVWQGVEEAIGTGIVLAVLGVLLYLPFYIGFQSQAGGLLPNLFNPTRLPQFLVMFGPLLVLVALFVILHWRNAHRGWRPFLSWVLVVWLLPWVLIALLVTLFLVTPGGREFMNKVFANPQVQANVGGRNLGQLLAYIALIRLRNPWTFLVLGLFLAWGLDRLVAQMTSPGPSAQESSDDSVSLFVLLLVTLGFLLTYAVEFVYIKDLFGTRMNTVFKFYYQTWVLWSVAGVYALAEASRRWRSLARSLAVGLAGLLIVLGLVYTVLAIPARSQLKQAGVTLNGEAWVAKVFPDDYAGILWVRTHTRPDDIVLEASGGSYTFFGRVSAFTGRATLLGWDFHELQWRGAALSKQAGSRGADIDRIYKAARGQELLDLLHRYNVAYLVVGSQERQKYSLSPVREKEFQRTLDLRFEQGSMRIYRVPSRRGR